MFYMCERLGIECQLFGLCSTMRYIDIMNPPIMEYCRSCIYQV